MQRYRKAGVSLAVGMALSSTMAWGAPQVPPSAPVTVVNTPSNPVPVTGSTTVSGSVAASQSGTWTVNVLDPGTANPFEGRCSGDLFKDDSGTCTIEIPAGYQLVIQAISASASVDPDVIARTLFVQQRRNGVSSGGHTLPFIATGPVYETLQPTVIRHETFGLAQALTWYFDPVANAAVCGAGLSKRNTSENASAFGCTITGYLVPR